ncbi:hypothetical protein TSUD_357570 [Trifolium subterraneum]|uniref:Uncharacterized protein n=1 Tax=Trifolium subterraneum TaxID=3900 RepID=A0A2Z6MUZ5_TRISU|nr:hypothetical protein TSUD_357570 [Trifolium subterraneum]
MSWMKPSKTVAGCTTMVAGRAFQISTLLFPAALGFEIEERKRKMRVCVCESEIRCEQNDSV